MKISKKISLLLIIVLLITATIGFAASAANEKEINNIKDVLIKSVIIADKAYIDFNSENKKGSLKDNKSKIISSHSENVSNVFSEKISNDIKKKWIDDTIEQVADGPDCIETGVSNITMNEISIKGETATVTAIITKYLIDRVQVDGKQCLDKMEGNVIVAATLAKENNKWKITEFNAQPDMDSTSHTLTIE